VNRINNFRKSATKKHITIKRNLLKTDIQKSEINYIFWHSIRYLLPEFPFSN